MSAPELSPMTRFCRDAWLLVATGGWWKPGEILDAMTVKDSKVHRRLTYMAERGYLVRREIAPDQRQHREGRTLGARERLEFAVTDDCVLPYGLTAREVSKALLGRQS